MLVALATFTAPVAAAKPLPPGRGNSLNAKDCQKGAYLTLVGTAR